jgi:hypothetical protein
MPANAGSHGVPAKQALLFLKKKKQKNFHLLRALLSACQRPQDRKFFASFF